MILAVSLNPCLDRIVFVPELKVNTLNRGQKTLVSAGGKGVNVAKVISALDEPVCVTGFFAGSAGRFIIDDLAKRNVRTDPVWIVGQETRVTTNLLDMSSGKETEITEPGPKIGQKEADTFLDAYKRLVAEASVVVLSGSVPVGIREEIYVELIRIAKGYGKRTLLDAGGELLRKGIRGAPFMIKPNIRELNALIGTDLQSPGQILHQCDLLHQKGILNVCVSMGQDGALLSCEEGVFVQNAFLVDVVNTIGSGDAMVAGLAVGIKRGYSPLDMLRLASACAASNASFLEIGVIDKDQVNKLLHK